MRRNRWILFLGCVLTVPLAAYLLPGVSVTSFGAAVLAGVVLGICWMVLRPVLKVLSFPVNFLTLGIFGFIVDGIVVSLAAWLSPGLSINNFWWGLLIVILLGIVRWVLTALFDRD